MFAKLLKHEMKSVGGLLGILSPAALAAGILGGLLLRTALYIPPAYEDYSVLPIMVLPFIFFTLFAYAFGSEIYMAVQFYKRKFTDEGYLAFTLPVATWQTYLSSLLNMMFWMLVIFIVTILSFIMIFFVAFVGTEEWKEFMSLEIEFSQLFEEMYPDLTVWTFISPVVSFVSSNVLMITSITLGCVLAKKHKILASIGCYYAVSMVISTVSTVVSTVSLIALGPEKMLDQMYLISAVMQLIVVAVGSFLSIWLMDKKLNLP